MQRRRLSLAIRRPDSTRRCDPGRPDLALTTAGAESGSAAKPKPSLRATIAGCNASTNLRESRPACAGVTPVSMRKAPTPFRHESLDQPQPKTGSAPAGIDPVLRQRRAEDEESAKLEAMLINFRPSSAVLELQHPRGLSIRQAGRSHGGEATPQPTGWSRKGNWPASGRSWPEAHGPAINPTSQTSSKRGFAAQGRVPPAQACGSPATRVVCFDLNLLERSLEAVTRQGPGLAVEHLRPPATHPAGPPIHSRSSSHSAQGHSIS